MRYFGKFYLDKEKDIVVTLWMEQSVLSYTIHAINHQSDNLINKHLLSCLLMAFNLKSQ